MKLKYYIRIYSSNAKENTKGEQELEKTWDIENKVADINPTLSVITNNYPIKRQLIRLDLKKTAQFLFTRVTLDSKTQSESKWMEKGTSCKQLKCYTNTRQNRFQNFRILLKRKREISW